MFYLQAKYAAECKIVAVFENKHLEHILAQIKIWRI